MGPGTTATEATAAAAATEEEGTMVAGPEWTTDPIKNATATTGTAADPAVRMEQDSREVAATAAADTTAITTAVAAVAAAEGVGGPNIPTKEPGSSTRNLDEI
jgi:hypothetical protein